VTEQGSGDTADPELREAVAAARSHLGKRATGAHSPLYEWLWARYSGMAPELNPPRSGSGEQAIPLANSELAICSRHLASWRPRSAGVADGPPRLLNGRCGRPGEFANGIACSPDPDLNVIGNGLACGPALARNTTGCSPSLTR